MHVDKIRGGFLAPLKAIASEKGSLLMLVVAAIWSISAVYDKVATVDSSPPFYTTFFSLAFALAYAPFLVLGMRKRAPDACRRGRGSCSSGSSRPS